MTSRLPRLVPLLVLLLFPLLAAAAPHADVQRGSSSFGAVGGTSGTAPATSRADRTALVIVTRSQRTVARRNGLAVRVGGRRGLKVRLRATMRFRGTRARGGLLRSRVVRLRSARRTVRLRLTVRGRRQLGRCRDGRVTVAAYPVRRSSRRRPLAKRSASLRRDRRRCGGGNAPGTDPDDPKPGDGGDASDVNTANADRCDFLDPSVCLYPFPNNQFTKADSSTNTGLRVSFDQLSMPRSGPDAGGENAGKPIEVDDYNVADGFSPGQALVTRVPGLDNAEAFRRTGAVPIDDPGRSFDAEQPVVVINTRTHRRHLIWAEIDSNPADPKDRTLIIRPGVNWSEGTRYVVALRNLKDAGGSTIPATKAFRLYRDRLITTKKEIEDRRPRMERLFTELDEAGIRRRDLYLTWDFTVASARNTTSRLLSIRDRAFAELGDTNLADLRVEGRAPTFTVNPDLPNLPQTADADGVRDFAPCSAGASADCEAGEDAEIARRIKGTFVIPCFLDQPGCPSGSQFAFDDGNTDVPRRIPGNTYAQRFTCQIPRVAVDGPTVIPGRPSLYGHGLFGSGQTEIEQGQLQALGQEHNFVFCATEWDGMALQDLANTFTVLGDLSRFPTLIDHVQQGFVNMLYLGRLMVHPDGFSANPEFRFDRGAGPQSVIDTRRLFYDGNSQGGIYGGTLAAIGVDHERATLGVPGMNFSTLLRRSVDFDVFAQVLYRSYPDELERPLVLGLLQMLWDRGDPNGYAQHMTDDPLPNTPRHQVLLHPAFGDHQVADVTTEVEARTIGARIHQPALSRDRYRDPPFGTLGTPFFGLTPLPAEPFAGSGLVFWDSGPARMEDGQSRGTPPPPAANLPNREGKDPHEEPRNTVAARLQKSEFLKIDGRVVDVCGGGPCYSRGYSGP